MLLFSVTTIEGREDKIQLLLVFEASSISISLFLSFFCVLGVS